LNRDDDDDDDDTNVIFMVMSLWHNWYHSSSGSQLQAACKLSTKPTHIYHESIYKFAVTPMSPKN